MSFKTRHSILFSPETERGQPYIYRKLRKQKLLQIMSISLQKFYLVHGQTGRRTDGDLPYKFCQRVDVVKYKQYFLGVALKITAPGAPKEVRSKTNRTIKTTRSIHRIKKTTTQTTTETKGDPRCTGIVNNICSQTRRSPRSLFKVKA